MLDDVELVWPAYKKHKHLHPFRFVPETSGVWGHVNDVAGHTVVTLQRGNDTAVYKYTPEEIDMVMNLCNARYPSED